MLSSKNELSNKSVLIDGKNMSLHHGTGIATYARNLCSIVSDLDCKGHVLYGENFSKQREPFYSEIAFFDQKIDEGRFRKTLRRIVSAKSYIFPPKPFQISMSDRVIKDNFKSQLPIAHQYWNASNIFDTSVISFHYLGKMQTIKNPMNVPIAHWTYPVPLKLEGAKNIYTIHDLVPLRLPYTTLDRKKSFYKMIETICAQADKIITVSEQSKKDIHEFFGLPDEKVVNTYQHVDIPKKYLEAKKEEIQASIKGLFDLDYKEYILFYGAIEPKKNVGRLIEAYLASGLDIPLVIAGKDGWLVENELKFLDAPSVKYLKTEGGITKEKSKIIRLNYVPFPQLVNLIRGAKCVAFPSLYEGFGLPIVESMICETPVLTSNLGATKEIAGEAALLVDPYDVRSIRDGILKLFKEESLVEDKGLAPKNIQRFTAQLVKEKIKEVYNLGEMNERSK